MRSGSVMRVPRRTKASRAFFPTDGALLVRGAGFMRGAAGPFASHDEKRKKSATPLEAHRRRKVMSRTAGLRILLDPCGVRYEKGRRSRRRVRLP